MCSLYGRREGFLKRFSDFLVTQLTKAQSQDQPVGVPILSSKFFPIHLICNSLQNNGGIEVIVWRKHPGNKLPLCYGAC